MGVLQRFFQKTFAMLLVLLYNKDNLGGFPMQIRKRRGDLVMVIITAVFFVLAAALFYLIPTLDQAVAASSLSANSV